MDIVEVWRGKLGDPIPLFGPLPGVRIDSALAYEWRLPDEFLPWPGRSQIERTYVLLDLGVSLCDPLWREAHLPNGRHVDGVGSQHGDEHTWYVDLVDISQEGTNTYFVRDLFIDVIVPMDGRSYRMLDLDEFGDAVAATALSPEAAVDGLRRWQLFMDRHLHSGREADRSWSDFPPEVIGPLQDLPQPLGPVVSYEF